MSTLRELLAHARKQLSDISAEAALDSEVLLAHALNRDRSWLYAWPEHIPAPAQAAAFAQMLLLRQQGQPVAYLTGQREFWSLCLGVSADTLIPRPETEQLVELALELGLPDDARVLDLGTGCGAIALALCSERPGWRITAIDHSLPALEVARQNACNLGLDGVRFLHSDWFAAVSPDRDFNLILSNPPYIAEQDPHLERGDLRFEPQQALSSGADGLRDIRRITAGAPAYLKRGGWLWLEHGNQQGGQVARLLELQGFQQVTVKHDLAGHQRHTGGRLASISKAGISG